MSPPCPKGGGPVLSPGTEGGCGSPTAIPGVPVLGRGGTQNLSVLVQSIPSKDRGRIWASRELLALHGGLGSTRMVAELWGPRAACGAVPCAPSPILAPLIGVHWARGG